MPVRNNDVTISKFLSLVLRHNPGSIDLVVDSNGWADTKDLIKKMNQKGFDVTEALLDHIVATNPKKRFSFNENKTKIRASQGHSIDVDLDLQEAQPPEYLYHGTAEKNIGSILREGIDKRARHHVHLSIGVETAKQVAQRHGKPAVFRIAAAQMKLDGFSFYLSENRVWLTDNVPVRYLMVLKFGNI